MNKNADYYNSMWQVEGVSFVQLADHVCAIDVENEFCYARISLYGGNVLSFIPNGSTPLIYVCRGAVLKDGKAIRGGVPICAPWFGASSIPGFPAHGAVRTAVWEPDIVTSTVIVLKLNAESLPEKFAGITLNYKLYIRLEKELSVDLECSNFGSKDVDFSAAMHTYFPVNDIKFLRINGLDGKKYFDALTGEEKIQHGYIIIDREVDRIYQDGGAQIVILDNGKIIRIDKRNSNSTVVWNPWSEKAKSFSDYEPDEYTDMVCVEVANAREDARIIPPGTVHRFGMTISEIRS